MRMVRFNSSWYWPRRGRRVVWWGVIIVVLVVLGFAAGYGETMLGTLATAVASAAMTDIFKGRLRGRPRTA